MRIEHLTALLAVAKSGSINKTSHALHMSQQQLSRIIMSLEQEFGADIFIRTHKGVLPTTLGTDILHTVTIILENLTTLDQHITQATQQNPPLQGTITAHVIYNIWTNSQINRCVEHFITAHPEVSVKVNPQSSPAHTIDAVANNPQHIGVLLKELTHYSAPLTIPDELLFLPSSERRLVVYAAVSSTFAQAHQSISLKALAKEPLVLYKPHGEAISPLNEIFKQYHFSEAKYNVHNTTSFFNILHKGLAISIGFPKYNDPESADLVFIPIREKIIVQSGLLVHKDGWRSPLIKTFNNFYTAEN